MVDMSLHPRLLGLERDSSAVAKLQDTPFLLSLRDSHEFSSLHSFGLFRVPHIGVYGSEYTVCSPVALLSLPAVPRVLKQLPLDLVLALDLDATIKRGEEPRPNSLFRPPQISGLFPAPSEAVLVSTARELVDQALQSAIRRVTAERKTRTGNKSKESQKMDFLGIGYGHHMRKMHPRRAKGPDNMEISVSVPVIRPSTIQMDVGSSSIPSQVPVQNQIPSVVVADVELLDADMEAEIRDVARRLAFKCIRSACYLLESERGYVDPIDDLISSTKRMRISSPSPYPSHEEKEVDLPLPQAPPPELAVNGPEPEVPERCLTPESLKRQNIRKKRGRSDSHEVNSLVDYDKIRRHFGRRGMASLGGSIAEVEEGNQVEEEEELTSLVRMMTIDEADVPDFTHEFPLENNLGRNLHKAEPRLFAKTDHHIIDVGSNAFSFTDSSPGSSLATDAGNLPSVGPFPFSNPIPTPVTKVGSVPLMCPSPLYPDPREAANVGAVPHMDLYVTIHSCPPSGLCQKFLCYNTNEINLMYHCWLFHDVSFDPHVTVTNKLEVGVFDPCGVQAIHTELQDAGAPFHFMEERTVCIHNCCFSPNNLQLQLQESRSFHTFFSAARHGERRVAVLHILPATTATERAVRETLANCSTLQQFLGQLNSHFPEITSKFSKLILSL